LRRLAAKDKPSIKKEQTQEKLIGSDNSELMTALQKTIAAQELSKKLILVEDIWDSITKTNLKIPIPEWQKSELDKRSIELKNGTSSLGDWKSVHTKLRSEINET